MFVCDDGRSWLKLKCEKVNRIVFFLNYYFEMFFVFSKMLIRSAKFVKKNIKFTTISRECYS